MQQEIRIVPRFTHITSKIQEDMGDKKFEFYEDKILGPMAFWKPISPTEEDMKKLQWCIENIDNYSKYPDKYREYLESEFVKIQLIPGLLVYPYCVSQYPHFSKISISIDKSNKLLKNKQLFQDLAAQGAEYQHIFLGGMMAPGDTLQNCVEIEMSSVLIKPIVNLFGLKAITYPYGKKTFLSWCWTGKNYSGYPKSSDKIAAQKEDTKSILSVGADINERMDSYDNTLLHYLTALEFGNNQAVELIEISEKLSGLSKQTKNNSKIDYTLQDQFGKTVLFLACGLGSTKIIDKLFLLKKEKPLLDIGLDIKDSFGRTPAMIAAALGHKETLEKLILAGCNLDAKDKEGRDINWYRNAPESEVRKILEFLSVNPDRAVGLHTSYLPSNDSEKSPFILIDQQNNEYDVILSPKEPYYTRLRQACQYICKNRSDNPKSPFNFKFFIKEIAKFLDARTDGSEKLAPYVTHYNNPIASEKIFKIMAPLVSGELLPIPTITEKSMENQLTSRVLIDQKMKEAQLRMACALGDIETVKKLVLEENVNVNATDLYNRSALHFVVMGENLVQDMLKSKPSYAIQNAQLCMSNHVHILKILLQNNGNIHLQNLNNNSAMSILTRDSYKEGITGKAALEMLQLVKDFQKQKSSVNEEEVKKHVVKYSS